jgi:hypothetical protein
MDNFQEFLRSFRPQHFAVGGPINLIVNTLVMWFLVNQLMNVGEKVSMARCAVCALLLYAVSALSISLLLLPVTMIFVLAFFVWLVGSMLVIQNVFQLTYQGGGGIFFLYLLLLLGIHLVVRQLMA